MSHLEKPFVSFIVMVYNAELFVSEALEGAFSQTYENMEIIISDDCSTDNSIAIIEERINSYAGNHKVRFIKNAKNMGLSRHLNKLWFQEAKGDWIVVSAGDDVSLPFRTKELSKYMNDNVSLIHSKSFLINEKSEKVEYTDVFSKTQEIFDLNDISETIEKGICVRGATMAINKKVLNLFGGFNSDVINEDVILAYRCQQYGKIIHIEKELMYYRQHSSSISYYSKPKSYNEYTDRIISNSKRRISVINQIFCDNHILNLPKSTIDKLLNELVALNIKLDVYGSKYRFKNMFKNKYWIEVGRKIKYLLKRWNSK